MVSIRPQTYYGLEIVVRPLPIDRDSDTEDKSLFLTGDEGALEVMIVNKRNQISTFGQIAIQANTLIQGLDQPVRDHFIVRIGSLAPNTARQRIIPIGHNFEGQVVVAICDLGKPEDFRSYSEEEMLERARETEKINFLCSYRVLDSTMYALESKRHEATQNQLREFEKNLQKTIATQIDQTIQARLAEFGLGKGKTLKSEVTEEKASIANKEAQKPSARESSYIT